MEAVNALGYVLDQSAGSLSSARSGFVAALVPSINNSNFSDTARGITDALENTGLQLLLGYTDYSSEKEEKLIEAMLRRRPEGMILTGGTHTDARAAHAGKSRHSRCRDLGACRPSPSTRSSGFSNERGDGAAGADACQAGLSQVRLYRRHDRARYARQPARGRFLRAFQELGLPTGPRHFLRRAADLHRAGRPGDRQHAGALAGYRSRALRLRPFGLRRADGMQAPRHEGSQDIAIAGFGDYEISAFCHPRITTVNVDCYGIGRQAAARMLDALHTGEATGEEITLTGYRVVLRESTDRNGAPTA